MSNNGACWRCTQCGWVDCYTAEDLAEYGRPTECQDHYHESLIEIPLTEGWAALCDAAAMRVRKAQRDLTSAEKDLADIQETLHKLEGPRP